MMTVEYIFCIGTGRNGTDYLRSIFAHVEGCVAEHEPVPRCNREPMRKFLNGNEGAMRALMPAKLAQIERSRAGAPVYMESNHCFIKGFGWLIPEHIDQKKIAVITVSRESSRIVDSYMRIGSTCLSENGRNWQIMPSRKNPLVPPPVRWGSARLTHAIYQLLGLPYRHKKLYKQLKIRRPERVPESVLAYERECLAWYVRETEALADQYQRRFPDIAYRSVALEDLNDPDKVQALLDSLGLQALPSMADFVGVPTNLKLKPGV